MDFKMYTQGLVDIINTYENNPDEMVEKIIDFYDTATQDNKLKMREIKHYYRIAKERLTQISDSHKLSAPSKLRIEMFEL